MNRQILLRWLRINTLFFAAAFIVALLLALLFPDVMLGFVRRWGAYTIAVGPIVAEPASEEAFFINIFSRNSFVTFLYFMASLFFLAPLLALIGGTFYSLGLMSAVERGVTPFWHPPVLITVEVSLILLTITLSSALGSEIFGVKPGKRELIDYWKKNWNRLVPKQKRNWRIVFGENKEGLILFVIAIFALILFGAWFEISM